jgi:hypothetical protein
MARQTQKTTRESPRNGSQGKEPLNSVARGPAREQIERRAYQLFLARGGAPGDPTEDWLQAERELRLGRY